MTGGAETVGSIAARVGGRVMRGDAQQPIRGVGDVRTAGPDQLGFIASARFAGLAAQTAAGALLVTEELETRAALIAVDEPHAAFALVARLFHPTPRAVAHTVHPTAAVHPDAVLEAPVEVGPGAVVEAGAQIGAGTVLQAGAVVGRDARVGRDCVLYPRAVLYHGVRLGDRCILHAGCVLGSDGFGYVTDRHGIRHKFPQIGGLVAGDDVEIGANTTVDRGALTDVVLGDGVKIDNLCHIGHNCRIGAHSSLSAGCLFAAGTMIGARCTLAGHILSAGNVTVCDDVLIGGSSVLTSDVTEPGEYGGYPLVKRAQAARTRVLFGKLPELYEAIRTLRARG